jgi:hypothetical protein
MKELDDSFQETVKRALTPWKEDTTPEKRDMDVSQLFITQGQLMSRTKTVHSELVSLSPGSSPMPDSPSSSPQLTVLMKRKYSSKPAFLVETVSWQR